MALITLIYVDRFRSMILIYLLIEYFSSFLVTTPQHVLLQVQMNFAVHKKLPMFPELIYKLFSKLDSNFEPFPHHLSNSDQTLNKYFFCSIEHVFKLLSESNCNFSSYTKTMNAIH